MRERSLTVRDTKNRTDHTLPLSEFLMDVLTRRRADTETAVYVFEGRSRLGHIVNTDSQRSLVIERSGVSFSLHDLRRTFITIAESLDIPAYALKRLLNHKGGADVTAGYLVIDAERLREPMQKITDFILKAGGVRESAAVVALREAGTTS